MTRPSGSQPPPERGRSLSHLDEQGRVRMVDVGEKPITDRELNRAKNQVVARTLRQLQDKEELATELAFWEMRGGWENINGFPEGVQKVTAQQVQDVCKKYFYRKNSTAGVILAEEEERTAAKSPASKDAAKKKAAAPGAAAPVEGGAE